MKMKLNSEEFEVSSAKSSENQVAASVKVNDGVEGDITIIGKIANKLILSPVISETP